MKNAPRLLRPIRRKPGLLPLSLLIGSLHPAVVQAAPQPATLPPQHLPIEAFWCPADSLQRPSAPAAPGQEWPGVPSGCLGLEVPRSARQYSLGLQLREPLPERRGMWFAYRPARVARFWMHRTPNPLDLIFVRNDRVVALELAVPPCMRLPCPSYGPAEPVDGVLELAAGQSSRWKLRLGSPLKVRLLIPAGPSAPEPD